MNVREMFVKRLLGTKKVYSHGAINLRSMMITRIYKEEEVLSPPKCISSILNMILAK